MKCIPNQDKILPNLYEIDKHIKLSENIISNKVLEPLNEEAQNEKIKYSTEVNYNKDILDYKTNCITIIYKINPKSVYLKIFGTDFVKNNKNKCKLIHKSKIYKLMEYFEFNEFPPSDIFEIKLLGINDITDISYMFSNCTSLISLPDISNLDITKFTKLSYMFNNCQSLVSLPEISKWNTSNIIYMDGVFKCCKSLISLPNISNWNTSNVIDMSYMFCNCTSLSVLPDLSKWDISKVINMTCMFIHCKSLYMIPNFSGWDKSNNRDISNIFYNCISLTYLPKNFKNKENEKYDTHENCFNIINY